MRDEGGPFEFGNQVLISSHRKLLWSKAMVVSVAEKSGWKQGRSSATRFKPDQSGNLGAVPRAIVAGKSAEEAYARPGYKLDRGNSSRLTANDTIRAQVDELKGAAAQGRTISAARRLRAINHAAVRSFRS